MIGRIRRLIKRTDEEFTSWEVKAKSEPELHQQEPELEEATETNSSLPPDVGTFSPEGDTDYFMRIIKQAIAQGGQYGMHHIPLGWLRLIQAGLEGKRLNVEDFWDGYGEPSEKMAAPILTV